MPSSRWDSFAVREIAFLADGIEAVFLASGQVDVPLCDELLEVMDARGAGSEAQREEMRKCLRKARGPLSTRIKMADPQPPYDQMRKVPFSGER